MKPILIGGALVLAVPFVASALTIDMVTVGNPGNDATPAGDGSVGYVYQIGTFEIMNSQYVEFLNSVAATDTYGLYNTAMGTDARGGIARSGSSGSYTYSVRADMADKPVNYVSFYDAVRFVNWLENAQPSGGQTDNVTETGSYTLFTDGSTTTNVSDRGTGATWVIPTDEEWFKAAYYDPTAGATSNYWLYPTRSDSVPAMALADATGDITNAGFNVANYNQGADWNGQNGNVTTVGGAGELSASYYGTFDQGGNVQEWIEGLVGTNRVMRGGSFAVNELSLRYSIFGAGSPYNETSQFGFRIAMIPEPCCAVAMLIAVIALRLQPGRRFFRR